MSDERFIPGSSRITEIESFHRYLAAAELCRGKKVLDAASGEGYGSDILAAAAAMVTGLDICREAVEAASAKYTKTNLKFVCGDAHAMPFPDGSFDCAVSFETIEHLDDPEKLVSEIRRVLTPGGFVILSSPNKTPFDRRNHCENGENVYHKHEMECGELVELMKRFFPRVDVYAQDSFFNSQIGGNSAMRYFVRGEDGGIFSQEALTSTQYSIILAGKEEVPVLPPSSCIDANFDARFGYQPDDEAVVNQFGLRGDFERAAAELEAERGQTAELRTREAALSEQLRSSADDLGKSRAECESVRGELDLERAAHQATSQRLETAENILADARENAAAWRKEVDTVRGELNAERDEHNELRDKFKTAESALAEARKDVATSQKEVELTRIQLTSERDAHGELKKQHRTLENALAEALRDTAVRKKELEAARGQLTAMRSARDELREQNRSLETALGSAQDLISSLRGDLGSVRTDLAVAGRDLEQTRRQLADSKQEAAKLLETMEAQRCADNARIADLERRFSEENAKAEYLWSEYERLRQAWSLRIFGRFNLRERARRAGHRTLELLQRGIRGFVNRLPMRYTTRMDLKNSLYRRFGFCFKLLPGYSDWQLRRKYYDGIVLKPGAGLEIPDDLPMTSIIIPVYNNLKYTLPCLYSIYKIGSKAPFEIIVVDDCSTEDYASVLRREFPQVRVIRNEHNSGFLLTVNRGAREAKGEYVLILNNDTEVLPGWLDELATALYHHPEAGMIGSQLIHMRTDTLQESGNLICKDGGMLPLGRGSDPDHPEFSFFREVDFVSAASIILRKSVFVGKMKGFDTDYAPAYFEDPDLGLRLKKAGYRNYVMPLSRVMHMEMASYGDALDSRCERNRKMFFSRWKDFLAKHAVYDTPSEFSSCRKFSRERILYIDAEMPMADRGSGGMDAIFFMNYFIKRGFEVVFHGEYTPGGVPKYTEILLRMGVECVYLPHRKIWEYLESNGWTFSWLFISRIYQAQCFDRLLKKYCRKAHYIFDTVDLHFVREKLEADLRGDPKLQRQAARTKKFELAVARSADATIVISRDEKKLLEKEYSMTNVWHIPQARAIAGRKDGAKRKGAAFIGSAHPPNMDGLRYFHDEILPLLPKDFHLTIIGEALRNVMKEKEEYRDLLKCPQFSFVGFVPDLADVLDTVTMTVAPLRYGAGVKGKVASSMSCGVPCVSSNFGVEGTGMIHGKNILLAKTPQEFADAIKKLDRDPELWRKISDGGLEFLRNEYDPKHVEALMDKLFASVRAADLRTADGSGLWSKSPVLPKQEEIVDTED